MKPRRVYQLLAGYADGDAISLEARKIRDIARRAGLESYLVAPREHVSPTLLDDCLPLEQFHATADDWVLLHYATASPVSAVFQQCAARKQMRYHNITPPAFFAAFDDEMTQQLRTARAERRAVAAAAERVWACSEYSAEDLRDAGVSAVSVMPLFFTPADTVVEPDRRRLDSLSGLTNILFVGRIVPNKCVEDLITAFAWYHACLNPASRLVLVGSDRSCPRYFAMLRFLAARLGLDNVSFEGFLPPAGLAACYARASVFVCPSRHEGYCLPLIEAMCHDVPVVARNIGGMPDAMGGGGVRYDEADERELALLIHHVISDPPLRTAVMASQARRREDIRTRDLVRDFEVMLGDGL